MPDPTPATDFPLNAPALAAFLRTLPAPPDLLGLGEPTHGVPDFLHWRNRLFQALVQQHGFRSIALESDVLAGLHVHDFVLGGPGSLEGVMASGFSHHFGTFGANRELVAWLLAFNAERPETDQVRFYGFDAPTENRWAASPRLSLLALHAFLAQHASHLPADAATLEHLCGPDARWTNEAAALDPTQSVGRTAEAAALRVIADDLHTLLNRQAPQLRAHPDFWRADIHARTALGLLRYHANMATPSPARVTHLLDLRGLMMAGNLSVITRREKRRGPTLAFAHNTHLQRHRSRMRLPALDVTWCSAGAHMAARLDERYAFTGSTLGTGAGLPEPAADTLEGHLLTQTSCAQLYATRDLLPRLPEGLRKRTDTSHAYLPLDPDRLAQMDGLLFLPAAQP